MKNLLLFASMFFAVSVVAQNTDSSNYYLQQGQLAKKDHRYQVALNQLQKALQFNPSNMEVQKGLGQVYVEMRQYENARKAFGEVIKANANDTMAVENLANLSFWTRKWNDAITYGRKMQAFKTGKNTSYIIGKSYYELEDYGNAYTYLQQAGKEDTANAEIPYTIARSFVDMSNYRAAAPFFERAIKLDTTKPRWVYECALNFGAIPDDRNAVKYYLLAADRGYKTDNDYYENLSISYQGIGQIDKCIELLKKVLEKKPADIEILNALGEIHYKIGKYQDAIDYWDRILGFDKQNAKALYMIGLAYQKKGDKEKGMQLCDQAIKMDPSLQNLKQKKMSMGL